jgi:hypothetical protein
MVPARFTPRSLIVARLVLAALLANIGLGAVCDARCAVASGPPAGHVASQPRAANAATPLAGARAGHCRTSPSPAATAAAGHHVSACQHDTEITVRAADSRGPVRVDLVVFVQPGDRHTRYVPRVAHGASRDTGPPAPVRAHCAFVLRI